MRTNRIVLSLAALVCGTCLAQEPEGNLIPDYDLARVAEVWRGPKRVTFTPGQIGSFEGMPEFLNYVTVAEPFALTSPEFALKTNTWYQGEVVIRAVDAAGRGPELTNGNELASLAFRGDDKVERAKVRLWRTSETFRRLRLYFNSGDRTTGRLVLRGLVPGVAFGRVTFAPVTAASDRKPAFVEPTAGAFRLTGGRKETVCRGQPFLVCDGERLIASVKVKAAKPIEKFRFDVRGELGFYCRDIERITPEQAGKWVTLTIDRVLDEKRSKGQMVVFQPSFIALSAADNEVEFKDLQVALLPRAEHPTNGTRNKAAWNPSFESGLWGWSVKFFRYPAPGDRLSRMELDDTTAAEGSTSLKVICENGAVNVRQNRAQIQTNILRPAPQKDYTVSFWAKADRPTKLTVSLDHTGRKTFTLTEAWQRYAMTGFMNRVGAWEYNELKFTSDLKGQTFWLDGVQVEEGQAATAFVPGERCEINCELPATQFKIYHPEEPRTAELRFRSFGPEPLAATAEVTLEDFRGQTVKTVYSADATLAPGETRRASVALDPGRYGWFQIRARLKSRLGDVLAEGLSAFAVVPHPENVSLEESFCGMMVAPTHVERNGKDEGFQIASGFTLADEFAAYAKCGVRWVRLQPPGDWWANEREKGRYAFEKWDPLLDVCKKSGIGAHVDFLIHAPPDWSFPEGRRIKGTRQKPEVRHVVDFAEAWSRHFAGKIDSLQFQNETGGYDAPDFFAYCQAVTPIFRRNLPGVKLMYPSFPGIGLPPADAETPVGNSVRVKKHGWIDQLFELGIQNLCDEHDFHPYINGHATSKLKMVSPVPFDWRESSKYGTFCETLAQRIRRFREQVSPTLPIVDSESGFIDIVNASWLFLPPLDRADWYTREVALGQSVRYSILKKAIGFQREFYFMFLGLNLERHGLDLVCKDLTPTAALPARAVFAKFLDGAKPVAYARRNESTWYAVFAKPGKTVVAYWDASLENKPAGTLTVKGLTGDCYDVMGNRQTFRDGVLELDSTPHYFVTDAAPEAARAAFHASVADGLRPIALKLGLAKDGSVMVNVKNTTGRTMPAARYPLTAKGPVRAPQALDVAALEARETQDFAFRPAFEPGAPVELTLKTPDGAIESNTLRFPAVKIADGACPSEPSIRFGIDAQTRAVTPAWCDGRGSEPFDADIRVWRTDDALVLRTAVKGDTLSPAPLGTDIHKGDIIEYFFDFAPEFTAESDTYTDEGFRLKVAPTEPVRHELDRNFADLPSLRNSFVKLDAITSRLEKTAVGWTVETRLPLVRTLAAGTLFRFGVQVQVTHDKGVSRVNWTYGRVYKDVSRTGIAICE